MQFQAQQAGQADQAEQAQQAGRLEGRLGAFQPFRLRADP